MNHKDSPEITVFLPYRPPYLWDKLLAFLAGRAIRGVEAVRDGQYYRTVRLTDAEGRLRSGWIRVGSDPANDRLKAALSPALAPVLPQVLARIRCLFDLDCDPAAVYETLRGMNEYRPGLFIPGVRLPGCFDPFETSVRSVLGQQITVKAAGTLAARVARAFGEPIGTGIEGLTCLFPTPEAIMALPGSIEERFGVLGVIASRSRTIQELAGAMTEGQIRLDPASDPIGEMEKLRAIRGIGSWTAQYIAMRTMGYPDAFLETDAGVKKALLPLSDPKERQTLAENWRPWRSYATVSLWNTL
jgi:AraC family transcriptional regulator of adaptative response / DNA-3-methyladenine glycosylase II